VILDQPGWQPTASGAVEIRPVSGLTATQSGAILTLGANDATMITFAPARRDVNMEETRYVAEVATLFVPGPGAVNVTSRITLKPVQGRVRSVEVKIPEGLSVGDVALGPVGAWNYDPTSHLLRVAVEPAQSTTFGFSVELQEPISPLPCDVVLRPLRVPSASEDVGIVGVAFAGDAQSERLRPSGMSVVSIDDFNGELLPRSRNGQSLVNLQSAYRYSGSDAAISLRIASVAPEVRVTAQQILSLGNDRLVLAADITATITRAGVFQFSFVVPHGLDIEGVSGAAMSHWTEATEGEERIVTLHLNGRTMGEQTFAISLAGPQPSAAVPWNVPSVRLREASRQTGEIQVVPERGIRLRASERHNVSDLDPRTLGNVRLGALAFRLLEDDWSLVLNVEALEPWVTGQALQEVTAREGQTLTRLSVRYHIENAAVKQLRVRLPALGTDEAKTVRATGSAVSDFVAVPGELGVWEIRFQRGVIGDTAIQIEYQDAIASVDGRQTISPPTFEGVRQLAQFVAIRGGGRLEVEAPDLPRGWQHVDWSVVPVALQDRGDRSVPALTFRVAEPEKPLSIVARRHAVADALKLRVTSGELTTLFSPAGEELTAVDLRIDVAEKSALRMRLPVGARLFNTIMNGESVALVREGDAYLFHITGNTDADPAARVRVVYSVPAGRGHSIQLEGPRLNVPLENVAWRVVLPPGYALSQYRGALQLTGERAEGWFTLNEYQEMMSTRRSTEARQANDYLQTANTLLQHGQQQQASEVLMRAAKATSLDEASNEDARVQLRALRTQQAVVSLNTRRQRLYLDNNIESLRNEQLEQAANLNPLMKGKLDFDPQQLDQLLMGNSVEENAALRGIAGRIVDQQLGAESAPRAIDVNLPERGRVMAFTRRLQVNGDAPLELDLSIAPAATNGIAFGIAVLMGFAAIGGLAVWKRA
jgi:hypothetical protein